MPSIPLDNGVVNTLSEGLCAQLYPDPQRLIRPAPRMRFAGRTLALARRQWPGRVGEANGVTRVDCRWPSGVGGQPIIRGRRREGDAEARWLGHSGNPRRKQWSAAACGFPPCDARLLGHSGQLPGKAVERRSMRLPTVRCPIARALRPVARRALGGGRGGATRPWLSHRSGAAAGGLPPHSRPAEAPRTLPR